MSAKHIENVIRTLGGLMYLTGALIMSYNLWRTIRMPSLAPVAQAAGPAPALVAAE